jgi:tryptophan halogenase
VKYREGAFLDASWIAVYLGQNVLPTGHDMRAGGPPAEALFHRIQALRDEIRTTAERMPDHVRHIARYCPMATAA